MTTTTPIQLTRKGAPPDNAELALFLGEAAFRHWTLLCEAIELLYPGIFQGEWLYGGAKHGWGLRYKKSKPLCTLIPRQGDCAILMVFGAQERAKVETVRRQLSSATVEAYDAATTYHYGKWVVLTIDSPGSLADVQLLLSLKRRPAQRSQAINNRRHILL